MYDFGERLKNLRTARKLTQRQVAIRLNMKDKSSISGYENNIRNPTIETITQFALLYGVTSDYLLGIDNRHFVCTDMLTENQRETLNVVIAQFVRDNSKNKK